MIGIIIFVVLLVWLVIVMILFPPKSFVRIVAKLNPDVVFFGNVKNKHKKIAISIDDGIKGESTKNILDVAERYDAKLTWFIIRDHSMKNDPDKQILKRMQSLGHEIANHGTQDRPAIKIPKNQLERDIAETDEWIGPTALFRPGSGFFDSEMLNIVKKLNKRTVLGGVYPHDPRTRTFPSFNAWYCKWKAEPNDIIVLHDFPETVQVIESVLKYLREQQYQCVTVSELLRVE